MRLIIIKFGPMAFQSTSLTQRKQAHYLRVTSRPHFSATHYLSTHRTSLVYFLVYSNPMAFKFQSGELHTVSLKRQTLTYLKGLSNLMILKHCCEIGEVRTRPRCSRKSVYTSRAGDEIARIVISGVLNGVFSGGFSAGYCTRCN